MLASRPRQAGMGSSPGWDSLVNPVETGRWQGKQGVSGPCEGRLWPLFVYEYAGMIHFGLFLARIVDRFLF